MINKIKDDLITKKGKILKFRHNGSRNQIEEFEGIITNTYKSIFIIQTIDEKKEILHLLESVYINCHGLDANDKKAASLFPNDWYIDDNYEEKTIIVAEAIQKEVLIEETQEYQNYKGPYMTAK